MVYLTHKQMIRPVYGRGFLDKIKKFIKTPAKILLGSFQTLAKPLFELGRQKINQLPLGNLAAQVLQKAPLDKIGLDNQKVSSFISDNSKKLLTGLLNVGQDKLLPAAINVANQKIDGLGVRQRKRLGKGLKIL